MRPERYHLLPSLAAALLLLVALTDQPYSYYQVLRFGVCALAIFVAVRAWRFRPLAAVPSIIAAIIWNPIVPITAARGAWAAWDIIGAVTFIGYALVPLLQSPQHRAAERPSTQSPRAQTGDANEEHWMTSADWAPGSWAQARRVKHHRGWLHLERVDGDLSLVFTPDNPGYSYEQTTSGADAVWEMSWQLSRLKGWRPAAAGINVVVEVAYAHALDNVETFCLIGPRGRMEELSIALGRPLR